MPAAHFQQAQAKKVARSMGKNTQRRMDEGEIRQKKIFYLKVIFHLFLKVIFY